MIEPLRQARAALDALLTDRPAIEAANTAANALVTALRGGGKILLCGNGGSACDAAHFAEELTGRFRRDRPPLPALACTEPGHLTCTANDYGFEFVFSRWVEALAKPADAVILISTSGNSPNIINAAKSATSRGATTIGLLGKTGGQVAPLCTHRVIVPGETTDRIQELHMVLLHGWVEHIEAALF